MIIYMSLMNDSNRRNGTNEKIAYKKHPCQGRTSIQGQALYVRSARQTARTIEVRAVLRHFVPNKGLHPLRRYAAIPANNKTENKLQYPCINSS